MFGEKPAIGHRIRSWRDENVLREIVGVVADVPFESLSDRNQGIVYIPYAQDSWSLLTVTLRAASGPPEALAGTLRRTVAAIDPDLALARVGTMSLFARESVARERLSALLMSALAGLALTLAALGIYGVMSYSVAQRRQEMGVRLALGAAPRDLYRLVLTRGLTLTALGLIIGLALAVAAARGLSGLLYQTSPVDPIAFLGMTVILCAAALLASVLPARRAATADPLAALRAE
jgi:putative ABC transport system permease protein